MENKTVGIIATVVTALCCGCSGISMCLWGAMAAAGVATYTYEAGKVSEEGSVPAGVGIAVLCVGLIFIAIPVVVGFLTLRGKKP
jgi:hypothetical protein